MYAGNMIQLKLLRNIVAKGYIDIPQLLFWGGGLILEILTCYESFIAISTEILLFSFAR